MLLKMYSESLLFGMLTKEIRLKMKGNYLLEWFTEGLDSSMAKHLRNTHRALGLIPSSTKLNKIK